MKDEEQLKSPKQFGLKEILSDDHSPDRVKELSFEQGVKLLDELVAKVESGTLALDKAMLAYERGVGLVSHLRGLISGAEQKLKILQKTNSEIK